MNNSALTPEASTLAGLDSVAPDDDAHRDAELARLAQAGAVANPRRTRR